MRFYKALVATRRGYPTSMEAEHKVNSKAWQQRHKFSMATQPSSLLRSYYHICSTESTGSNRARGRRFCLLNSGTWEANRRACQGRAEEGSARCPAVHSGVKDLQAGVQHNNPALAPRPPLNLVCSSIPLLVPNSNLKRKAPVAFANWGFCET